MSTPEDHHPNPKDFIENMRGRLPLRRKLSLFFRNNAFKFIKRKACCGHPGEPGC